MLVDFHFVRCHANEENAGCASFEASSRATMIRGSATGCTAVAKGGGIEVGTLSILTLIDVRVAECATGQRNGCSEREDGESQP